MPAVSAETYSGLNRFVDNVKFAFSGGDKKVELALEIREKEVNSALEEIQNEGEDKAIKNLERARNKLQVVQEKVSVDMADEVKESVDNVVNKIDEQQNLPEQFELYKLEEQKTGLTAELVVEVEGKQGQTLTREVVKNQSTGKNEVLIVVEGEPGEAGWTVDGESGEAGWVVEGENGTRVMEIQQQMNQINNQIAERVVKIEMAGQAGMAGKQEAQVEVKTGGVLKNEPLPTPNLNKINPDLYDPNARAPGDTIDDTYDDNLVNSGSCGDGVDCGDGSAEPGVEGTNDVVIVTGNVIGYDDSNEAGILTRLFKNMLGR